MMICTPEKSVVVVGAYISVKCEAPVRRFPCSHLIQDVDEGLRRLMDNPVIRGDPVFAAEFHDDSLWPL